MTKIIKPYSDLSTGRLEEKEVGKGVYKQLCKLCDLDYEAEFESAKKHNPQESKRHQKRLSQAISYLEANGYLVSKP